MQFKKGEFICFEVLGPKTSEVICKALQPNNENPSGIINTLISLPAPSILEPGIMITYNAFDPRTTNDSVLELTEAPKEFFNGSELFRMKQYEFKSDEQLNRERAKVLFPMSELPSGSIPVVLIQCPSFESHGFSAGFLILLPMGTGAVVFRQFTSLGARPYGVDGARAINLECGNFFFPYDCPESPEGLAFISSELLELEAADNRRPPGKRVTPSIYPLPQMFRLSINPGEFNFIRVSIKMTKRGTPSRFATFFEPTQEDFANAGFVTEIKGERLQIGMVLEGNSSLLAGEGRGIGFIETDAFLRIPEYGRSGGKLVLLKEKTSQFFHPALVSVHYSMCSF